MGKLIQLTMSEVHWPIVDTFSPNVSGYSRIFKGICVKMVYLNITGCLKARNKQELRQINS